MHFSYLLTLSTTDWPLQGGAGSFTSEALSDRASANGLRDRHEKIKRDMSHPLLILYVNIYDLLRRIFHAVTFHHDPCDHGLSHHSPSPWETFPLYQRSRCATIMKARSLLRSAYPVAPTLP
jgi:hypothetical protein